MVLVDRSDGLLDALIPSQQSDVCLICGLVQGVVSRDPGVILVVLRSDLRDGGVVIGRRKGLESEVD